MSKTAGDDFQQKLQELKRIKAKQNSPTPQVVHNGKKSQVSLNVPPSNTRSNFFMQKSVQQQKPLKTEKKQTLVTHGAKKRSPQVRAQASGITLKVNYRASPERDDAEVVPKKMIKIVKRASPMSNSPNSFKNERCDISLSGSGSVERTAVNNPVQKQTLPLKSIKFVNAKNLGKPEISPAPVPSKSQLMQNQNLRILNANLVNLNPNGSNQSKKISLSNNVMKIIRKKSTSPQDPKKVKVSPVRGLLVKIRKSPSPPSDNRPVLATDFIKQMISKNAPEGKLKIRRSPPRQGDLNFTTDMKRHGIMADVQDVQETKKKLIIKQRHISPPPPLNTGEVPQKCGDTEQPQPETQQPQQAFKFPFQRRARSCSLPKDKDGNDLPQDQYDSNKPVIAKDNFVLAHKNLVPGVMKLIQQQQEQEIMMGQNKEVDEWLLGSGESAETAASNTKNIIGSGLVEQKQPIPKPKTNPEPPKKEEEESWMFRTFSKKGQVSVHIPQEQQEEENENLDEFMSNLESSHTVQQYNNVDHQQFQSNNQSSGGFDDLFKLLL